MPHPLNPDVPTLVDLEAEIEQLRAERDDIEAARQRLIDETIKQHAENAKLRAALSALIEFESNGSLAWEKARRALEEGAQE